MIVSQYKYWKVTDVDGNKGITKRIENLERKKERG